MKRLALLLALLCVFGYGAGGNKPSDKQYRCFGKIGKSTSNTPNEYLGGNKYCIPSPNTKNCQKSWLWELDKKNDRVTEMNSNCEYQCEVMGVGGAYSDTPVETYQYCVYAPDFHKVAQCVDKDEGKDANASQCDGDQNGIRYYYKPKCKENQTKEQCEASLRTITVRFGWRFCYKGSGQPNDMFKTMGGQTVQFQEYINDQGTASYPCNQNSSSPGGGNPPEPEKPGAIVIRDWDNNKTNLTQSIVWTKISGTDDASFKISTLDASGSIGSGISSLYCSLDGKAKAQAYKTSAGGFLGAIGLNQVYRYDAKGVPFPSSGYHTVKCEGTDSKGKAIAGEVKFYSAPSYYKYEMIEFRISNDNAKNGVIEKNLLDTAKKVYANQTEPFTYDSKNWTEKPVVKVGESIVLLARSVSPYTEQNQLDNVSTGIGVEQKNTLKSIKASDTTKAPDITKAPDTTTVTGCGTLNPQITTSSIPIYNGMTHTGENKILTLSSQNAILGTMELTMKDTDITAIIKTEEAQGKCGRGTGNPCPYPGTMKLVFDYQVVPQTFDIELLNANNQQLKVLYFGQGNNTLVEQPNKIKIKAYDLSKNVDTKFSSNCAAQDIAIDLNTKGLGYSIKLVDEDNNPIATIPANYFKNGVAEYSVFIKVMKADGIDFTPNMKSEPVFLKGGFPASINFAGFPPYPTSYYPQYKDLLANASDMVILRGRINAVDTDNAATRSLVPTPTKVYYEFQCEYCDLSRLQQITGVANYQAQKSKTQQGWFIDSTFATHNATTLNKNMISIENQGSGSIKNVTGFVNGIQEIQYGNLPTPATHKLNILHGNYVDRGNAIAMPDFLLYNAYWNAKTQWNTSAFIYMRGTAKDDNGRDYGLDTGGAKNTRSGGRTGGY